MCSERSKSSRRHTLELRTGRFSFDQIVFQNTLQQLFETVAYLALPAKRLFKVHVQEKFTLQMFCKNNVLWGRQWTPQEWENPFFTSSASFGHTYSVAKRSMQF